MDIQKGLYATTILIGAASIITALIGELIKPSSIPILEVILAGFAFIVLGVGLLIVIAINELKSKLP